MDLIRRDEEACVLHLHRSEQLNREELVQSTASGHLNHSTQHVEAEAILEPAAGLEAQWRVGDEVA